MILTASAECRNKLIIILIILAEYRINLLIMILRVEVDYKIK